MHTKDALKSRRSVREFDPSARLLKEDIEKLIDAARFAPSARNIQPWEFVVISNRGLLKEIGSMADNGRFIQDASACIAVFCKDTKYYLEDGCAATQNLLLAATDMGIDSCWVAGDKKPYCSNIQNLVGVPDGFKLVSLIALGRKKNNQDMIVEKRPLKEIIHWDRF